MHSRNPYRNSPDFLALAEAYPPLKPHIILTPKGPTIDFKNELSQRLLTEAILLRDFGLKTELPPDRLCPPVSSTSANRLNYILWLQDVVDAVSLALGEASERPVLGLDIGTGASAIYPLLGCRTRPNWSFTATEVDEQSYQSACRNVQANGLQDRIKVVHVDPAGPILCSLLESNVQYDFTMCNPPFYSSRDEVLQSAEAKELGPNAVCTGADVEMITPGGEAGFVGRMVEESEYPKVVWGLWSRSYRSRNRWFTSMLGKMSSLTHIVQLLRENNINNYAISELVQGQTRRWVIAWSFGDVHLPDGLARLTHGGIQHLMPARNTFHQRITQARSSAQVAAIVLSVLNSVDGLEIQETAAEPGAEAVDVVVSADANTWSRAARRKKRDAMAVENSLPNTPQLVCRVRSLAGAKATGDTSEASLELVFDWLRGADRALFEGFASHVERKVIARLSDPEDSKQ
ncbi:S-adenosyl-L-methionine dependent methyltransferase [Pilatotrama ljubarskyi]|nr:S-adenosyl-L-methionine dependent methyltransferase [Pilatotrama ljubarskyi]